MQANNISDDQAVRRFSQGDAKAFDILYERYRHSVWRYCTASSPAAPEDLFQAIWLAVIKGCNGYSGQNRFRFWLFTLARNTAIDFGRKKEPASDGADYDVLPAHQHTEPDAQLVRHATTARVISAIEALPTPQREAILLKAVAELSLAEIAEATGASPETVKSRLRYARARLTVMLNEEDDS